MARGGGAWQRRAHGQIDGFEASAVLGVQTQQLSCAPCLDQPLVELLVQLQRPRFSRPARRRVGPQRRTRRRCRGELSRCGRRERRSAMVIYVRAPALSAAKIAHAMFVVATRVAPNGGGVAAASMRAERMHHAAVVAPLRWVGRET